MYNEEDKNIINYLTEEELNILNRMVSAYLDIAELNVLNRNPMTMKNWVEELDSFLKLTRKDILKGNGKISHEKVLEKAHKEYDKYMKWIIYFHFFYNII